MLISSYKTGLFNVWKWKKRRYSRNKNEKLWTDEIMLQNTQEHCESNKNNDKTELIRWVFILQSILMLFLVDNCLHMLCLHFPISFIYKFFVHYAKNVPHVHMKKLFYLLTYPLCITLCNPVCGDVDYKGNR